MNNKNIYILAFTLVVMTLGIGVIMPIIPFFIENLGAGGTEMGLLVAAYAAMRLLFGPVWGSLSDRYGRKPILMIGVLGYGFSMIFFGLSTQLWMLFLSRTLSGILASATSPTTMAYISDTTSEEDRGRGMGILGAAMGIGTILGPGLGGLLASESFATPFFFAGGMSFLALILIAIFVPESLPVEERRTDGSKKSSIRLAVIWEVINSPVRLLLILGFVMTCGLLIFYGVFGLYALEKFGSGPEEVGVLFMVFGAVTTLAQGVMVGPLTRRWGEVRVIQFSFLLNALGFILIVLAQSFIALLWATGVFTLAASLVSPSVIALTSKRSSTDQGILMGVSNSFMSLGRVLGPMWAGFVFDIHTEIPYISGAVLMLVGFVISVVRLHAEAGEKVVEVSAS